MAAFALAPLDVVIVVRDECPCRSIHDRRARVVTVDDLVATLS